jgi:4'-phosphopantetheinyl transferase
VPREIASHFFSQTEIRQLDTCPPADYAHRFIEFWTLKEAFIKAIGTGLSHPLDSFSFSLNGNGDIGFTAPDTRGSEWQFALITPDPGYRLAVAVRRKVPGQVYRITMQG